MARRVLTMKRIAAAMLVAALAIFSAYMFYPPREAPDASAEKILSKDRPVFDVVRVDADGMVVMAGRSQPFAHVRVFNGEKLLGAARASGRGEWVLVLDQPLPLGQPAYLRLRAGQSGGKEIVSDQIVTIGVPQHSGQKPMVVLTDPARASQVLQSRGVASDAGEILLETVDYNEKGRAIFAGKAIANHKVRLYLDNRLIGEARSSAEESWQIVSAQAIAPGIYSLRIDLLSAEEKAPDKVIARISLPFRRASPADMAQLAERPDSVVIQPGDNLWMIARSFYGEGVLWTIIYQSNRAQIRDPDLIYPGQVFATPAPR